MGPLPCSRTMVRPGCPRGLAWEHGVENLSLVLQGICTTLVGRTPEEQEHEEHEPDQTARPSSLDRLGGFTS